MFKLTIREDAYMRILDAHEATALFAITDKNRTYLKRWLPWLDRTTTPEDSLGFVEGCRDRYANREALEAGLFAANRLVGMIGFNTIDWTARRSEIGYWIDSEYQGQGLVTQGCRSLIAHGFNELDLNRIEIRCATGNDRSRAIPERLGFTQEGIIRQTEWLYDHFEDHALYALLRSEWNGGL